MSQFQPSWGVVNEIAIDYQMRHSYIYEALRHMGLPIETYEILRIYNYDTIHNETSSGGI